MSSRSADDLPATLPAMGRLLRLGFRFEPRLMGSAFVLSLLAALPDALLALCMTTGLVTDYAALIEKRRFGSFSLAKKSHV